MVHKFCLRTHERHVYTWQEHPITMVPVYVLHAGKPTGLANARALQLRRQSVQKAAMAARPEHA